ncbi:MAG: alpha/beta hydrolase [Chloroflexota bacterium]|nr:alpha/beta hydrolase [Chloroflexota bacterium]
MPTLAYDQAGDGHPLLLVHAGIVDRHMWDPVWEALSARYRVIRPDLRGFGETPASLVPFTNWSDLADLLRSLDAAPAHVIGVSWGGSGSLDLALAEPGLVDRLVLVASGLAGWEWSSGLKADWEAEEAAWQRGDLDEVAWANVRTWVDGPLRGGEAAPELRQAVFDMYRPALQLQAVEGAMDSEALQPPASGRLAEVAVPTLVVVGDLDQPDMMKVGEHVAASIAGARLAVMHGVAPLPPMEAPDAFVDLVTGFLEG